MFDRNRSFLFLKSKCAFLKIGVFFENRCLKIHAFYWASLEKKIVVCCRKLEFCHLCLTEIGVWYLKIQAGFFLTVGDSFENTSLFSKIRVCHLCLIEIGVCYLNIMNPSCFFSWNLESVSKIGFCFWKTVVQTSVFDWNWSLAKLAEYFLAKESKRLEKNLPLFANLQHSPFCRPHMAQDSTQSGTKAHDSRKQTHIIFLCDNLLWSLCRDKNAREMSFIVYLLILQSFRATQSRIARINLYKD